MTITPQSLAAVNGATVENEQFAVTAQVAPQKNVIIGTYDETTFTGLTPNEPIQIFSAEQAGALTGFGFMLHRLARAAFRAGNVETWIIPQEEDGAAVNAAGSIAFTGPATEAGTGALYIAYDRVPQTIANGKAAADIVTDYVTAINADENLPVTASAAVGTLHLFAKSGGPWGTAITLAFSALPGEELPAGVTATITPMAGGAGIPDVQDALDAIGTGDAQNEKFFTNLIHGYGLDTTTLDAISVYNGVGNIESGNYLKTVAKPLRSLIGDTTADDAGKAAAIAAAELRRELDRTTGLVCAPGSLSHPQEIAAQCIGIMAVTNTIRAEEDYVDKPLVGVHPGERDDRWTNDFTSRDLAVRSGVGTTFVKNNVLTVQNLITFYRPASVSPESNGYRDMENISRVQNILFNFRANFERSKWKNITIVEDKAAVANVTSRLKARDDDDVIDDLVALAEVFAGNAWLYNSSYTVGALSATKRAGLTGWDIIFPVILSGNGKIFNSLITLDTSIAILAGGE